MTTSMEPPAEPRRGGRPPLGAGLRVAKGRQHGLPAGPAGAPIIQSRWLTASECRQRFRFSAMLDDVKMGHLRRFALAVVGVGVVAAAGASVAGFVLADIFRPNAPWVWTDLPSLPPSVQRSDRWTDSHQFASGVLLASAAISVALLLWFGAKRVLKRNAVAIAASAVALVMAGLTIFTRALVAWDQLALWSVTVGQDLGGYWVAGFHDEVRFVLVGNQELSQDQYVQALIVHLAAPIVAGMALLVVGAVLLRMPVPARRDQAKAPPRTRAGGRASSSARPEECGYASGSGDPMIKPQQRSSITSPPPSRPTADREAAPTCPSGGPSGGGRRPRRRGRRAPKAASGSRDTSMIGVTRRRP